MAAKRKPLTTVKQIQALRPEGTHYVRSVGGPGASGLYIRVLKSGQKFFVYRYRYLDERKTKTEWIRLGEYTGKDGGMDLADATLALAEQRRIVEEHGSVSQYREEQAETKAAELADKVADDERSEFTVKKMVADYVESISRAKSKDFIKSHRKVQLSLENHIVAKVGARPAHELRRIGVINALEDLDNQGKQVQRNRVIAYLKRVYGWSIENGKFDKLEKAGIEVRNPCDNIRRFKETPKERALAGVEIRRLLTNLPDSGIRNDIADVYRLILLLAARPGEVVRMKYSDIHEREYVKAGGKKKRIKVLILANTKNKSTLIQPLNEQALAIIEQRKGKSDYVFPSPKNNGRHLREDTLNKPLRDHIGQLKVLPFVAHDLRRTAVTEMSNIVDDRGQKITRFIKKLILNHADGSVTGTYDRFEYLEEKATWMNAWGAHVESVDEPRELRKVG